MPADSHVPGGGRYGVPLINAAAFQAPPVDANGEFLRFGNEPNGIIRALNSWQIDLALTKETKLTERVAWSSRCRHSIFSTTFNWETQARLTLAYQPTAAKPTGLSAPREDSG